MKKGLMIGLTLLISVAFVTCVFAQSTTEQATKAATAAGQEKAKAAGETLKGKATQAASAPAAVPAPEKKAEKTAAVKKHEFKGEVTAIDMAAKTLTVKGKKGDMTFDVTNAKMKGEPKVGEKVMVKYTETDGKMVAKYVSMKHHKHHKKGEKKAAAPAEPVAPAPAK